jgi:hypothetical protein
MLFDAEPMAELVALVEGRLRELREEQLAESGAPEEAVAPR